MHLEQLDVGDVGLADWTVTEEPRAQEQAALALTADDHHNDDTRVDTPDPCLELIRTQIGLGLDWIGRVAANRTVTIRWNEKMLARALVALVDADLVSPAGPIIRATLALSAEDASLHFSLALVLLSGGASGLQRAPELLNGMHAMGKPDSPLLAKLSLRVGCALLGLESEGQTENAVRSFLQWMIDRRSDFEPFVLLGVSERNFRTFVASMQGPAKASIEQLRAQMRFSNAQALVSTAAPDPTCERRTIAR